jgi:hypothetical protein
MRSLIDAIESDSKIRIGMISRSSMERNIIIDSSVQFSDFKDFEKKGKERILPLRSYMYLPMIAFDIKILKGKSKRQPYNKKELVES